MSTLNLVKSYFLNRPGNVQTIRQHIALAYQTAQDRSIYPTAVLSRSGIHPTTTIDGKYQKDPKGDHLTICFKDRDMMAKGTHTASHGYVDSRSDSHIREATHTPEKPDSPFSHEVDEPPGLPKNSFN
ncbi:hypothetical protein H109_08005 [Trichophyton interdigitale MR816]|uniref:Uncharacterized protein n=1 Tax=Trichophyton interdigitale (strain MR816) TaxID=1215338 RepID=A0A059IXS5_TRIIM|nr:hypothetical protein H101_02165 [Trichophyton interdigitale H6]KDB20037.1 hypothetical protein H109_08005 [Trichophyton interdigitale MR816]